MAQAAAGGLKLPANKPTLTCKRCLTASAHAAQIPKLTTSSNTRRRTASGPRACAAYVANMGTSHKAAR